MKQRRASVLRSLNRSADPRRRSRTAAAGRRRTPGAPLKVSTLKPTVIHTADSTLHILYWRLQDTIVWKPVYTPEYNIKANSDCYLTILIIFLTILIKFLMILIIFIMILIIFLSILIIFLTILIIFLMILIIFITILIIFLMILIIFITILIKFLMILIIFITILIIFLTILIILSRF